MPENEPIPLFRRAQEISKHEQADIYLPNRRSLLESPFTNEELLEPMPLQTKCLGALSVIAEMNSRLQALQSNADKNEEL